VLVFGSVAAAHGTLIVVCVLAGGLEAVMVAVPHPLPAVNKAATLPLQGDEPVCALAGVTVEPATPLVVNVTVALHTALPLLSSRWNCRAQVAPGLVLEQD